MKLALVIMSLLFSLFCMAMQSSTSDFYSQLSAAIKNDDQVAVEELFKKPNSTWSIGYLISSQKYDPNMRSKINLMKKGHALIHWAVRANNLDILDVLLNNERTQVDIENAHGCTALGFAVAAGNVQMTSLLLHHGANPNIVNKNHSTSCDDEHALLHSAIIYSQFLQKDNDYYKVIGLLLLDSQTDPNIQDVSGKTPLHYAVLGRNRKAVELLLHNSKTKRSILDKESKTPIDYAREMKDEKIEELLLNLQK